MILIERQFPVGEIYLLASQRSAGTTLQFDGRTVAISAVDSFDFSQADICFFSAGKMVSETYVPIALEVGCRVIDNTSAFRYQEDVPLLVAGVNDFDVDHDTHLVANPNCSTMQLMIAVKPLHDLFGLKRMIVSTYQAVSGAGQSGIDALRKEALGDAFSEDVFEAPIHQNVIASIDTLQENGYTREEMKIVWESQKILNLPELKVSATAVRVPVVNGHSEAVILEFERPVDLEKARCALDGVSGIQLVTAAEATPQAASGADDVLVSRLRVDLAFDNALSLWVVADNLRIGAATNAVQLAERLLQHH